jgi:peptidyl-prolyl cis-trans isomerase SurA
MASAPRIQLKSVDNDTANMTMTTTFSQRLSLLRLGCTAVLLLMLCAAPCHAQTVAVMVNGEPITSYDIEQRSKLNFLSTHKPQVRQQVIDELIDEKLKIKEAKKFSIDPSSSDIDGLYTGMSSRMHITPDQLTKTLASSGIRPETLKERMKAEMAWSSLIRGRFKESLQIGEKEVVAAAKSNDTSEKPDAGSFEYKMQPIVLIVARGSPPAAIEAKHKEAEALRNRVQTCDEANTLFKSMPDTAIRESVTRTSADLPASLRDMLDKTPIGHLTEPEVTKQGVEMVVLCDRKPTTVDTPKKKEVRDKMFADKYEAKSKSYLQEIRKAAMIERR